MSKLYRGLPISGGIGKGKVKIIDCSCPEFTPRPIEDTDRELGRFIRLLKIYCDNTRSEIQYIKDTIGTHEAEILNSHIRMVHDLALQLEMISKISNGMCAEQATSEICDMYIKRFLKSDEDFVRQLATDVKDVKTCVLNLLLGYEDVKVEDFGEDTVVLAKELTPSVVARLDRKHTKAVITEIGSSNSHGTRLVLAMHIPAVTKIKDIHKLFNEGELVTVDGNEGTICN